MSQDMNHNIIPFSRLKVNEKKDSFIARMQQVSTTNRHTGESYVPLPEHKLTKPAHMFECARCHCMVNKVDTYGIIRKPLAIDPSAPVQKVLTIPCPMCSPAVIKAQARKRVHGYIKTLVHNNKLFNMENLPVNAEELTMLEYPQRGDQQAKAKIQTFIDGVITEMYLTGKPGVGKTGLSIAAANELSAQGCQVLMISHAQYVSLLKANFKLEDQERNNHIEEIVKNVEILFMDDLGAENATDFTLAQFQDVIEYRHSAGLRTMISSNFNLKGLEMVWSLKSFDGTGFQPVERTIDRLRGWYELVQFNNKLSLR